ncbi:MAG: sialate O-acetylesterase [Planctomycetota bacterium]|jgi:hypothetical protein
MTSKLLALALLGGASLLLSFRPLGSIPEEPEKLHVFVLAGQSNMEGQAVVDLDHEEHYNGGRGTLAKLLEASEFAERWGWVRDADGGWSERDDVGVWYRSPHEEKKGPLSIGYAVYGGRHHFGPELALGRVLGERFEGPVLLVKACWGGKSLHVDFRPPSAGGEVGPYYERIFEELDAALADVGAAFPAWEDLEPELEGLFWFQGWNDGCDGEATRHYAENLEHLIGDVRERLEDRKLPVVVGQTGNMRNPALHEAQAAGTRAAGRRGPAAYVETEDFLRPAEDSPNTTHGHHWFGNAESYLLVGDALGEAMVGLLPRARRR